MTSDPTAEYNRKVPLKPFVPGPRKAIIDSLYRGVDPFDFIQPNPEKVDLQGWGSHHKWLSETVQQLNPKIVIEIGAWKGGSTITLAKALKQLECAGVVISVDTWMGSEEHWTNEVYFTSLGMDQGAPSLRHVFMNNVLASGLQEYVVPLPVDSINGSKILQKLGVEADLIHIDAGHDLASVRMDLKNWWPILKNNGILLMDDYYTLDDPTHAGAWPGVREAVDKFAARKRLDIEHLQGKARIIKRAAG